MTKRISITDIYDFSDTLAMRRAAKGKVTCYVEGFDDKRWYIILAGPALAARIDFVMPSDDFPGSKDGHEGVVQAVRRREQISNTQLCFGICDGDALAAGGNAHRLLRSAGVFVERNETDGNVLYLAYHEIENVVFCEKNSIEDAFFSHIGRDNYLHSPDRRKQLWMSLNSKALDLLDETMKIFAMEVVWRNETNPKASLEAYPKNAPTAHVDSVEDSLRKLIGFSLEQRLDTIEDALSNNRIYRFCMGKKLLIHLRTMTGNQNLLSDQAFINAASGPFGEAFRARLHRTVNLLQNGLT